MKNYLSDIYKKHQVWIDIVCSFGCNKETAEDITQETYIYSRAPDLYPGRHTINLKHIKLQ